MALEQPQGTTKGKLKVSLVEEIQGVKHVDLFVDYTSQRQGLRVIPNNNHTITDYPRRLLTPVMCPKCNSKKVSLNLNGGVGSRLLKITGRRVFACPECNTKLIAKVHRWEWEIVGTIFAAIVVVLLFSFQWFSH